MIEYFIIGSYNDTDVFASPVKCFLSHNESISYLWSIQEKINEIFPDGNQYQNKTIRELELSPIIKDSEITLGVFKVKANSEEEALLKLLFVCRSSFKLTNQIIYNV